jgi:DNA-binding NarL/FixJ family response regulator
MRWLPLTGAAEVLDSSPPRETMSPIRVAIADDHALFREGLKSLLCLQVDVTVVAELEHTTGLLLVLEQTPCDLLLADLEMEWSARSATSRRSPNASPSS